MIYADFESISIPENNEKQNSEESDISKYQKYIVGVGDKFSKPFKTHLGKDAVYNFINNKIEESKYYIDVMKKHFNKKLVMTKEDNEVFKNSTRYWICDNDYVHNDVKVRNHCHITEKYRDTAHRDCNINVKLNQKNFCQISQPKFRISSYYSFDNKVLDLIKQTVSYPYKYISDSKNFKKGLTSKKKFYNSIIGRKIADKDYEHVLNVWNKFEMKAIKRITKRAIIVEINTKDVKLVKN